MADEKKNFEERQNKFYKKPFNEKYRDYKQRQKEEKQKFDNQKESESPQNKDADKNITSEQKEQTGEASGEQNKKCDTIEMTTAELNKLKYQLAEIANKNKDLEHEFENYRTRTREELKQAKTDGAKKAIENILPALDSFKKAKQIVVDDRCKEGICMIEKSILSALAKQDVKPIEAVGKIFNPDYHNAIMTIEKNDVKENTIVDEVEMGFVMGDKVIKYSKVIVAK